MFVLLRVKLALLTHSYKGVTTEGLGGSLCPLLLLGGSADHRHCSGSSHLNPQPEVLQLCSVGCPATQPLVCSQATSNSHRCFFILSSHQLAGCRAGVCLPHCCWHRAGAAQIRSAVLQCSSLHR